MSGPMISALSLAAETAILRVAVAGISEVVFAKDADGRYLLINPAGAAIFGKTVADVVGRTDDDLFDAEAAAEIVARDRNILAAGESVSYRSVATIGGDRRIFLNTKYPLRDDQDQIVGIVGISRDITEEERADAQRQLQAILDHSATVVQIKDIHGRYLLVNRYFERVFHCDAADVIGKTAFDIFPQEIAAKLWEHDRMILAGGEPHEWEEVVPHDDGPHTYLSVKFPLRDVEGEIYGICGIATDITDRKVMEAHIRRQNEELQTQYELAQEASRLKSEFLANMSHELRTPLNAVIGFAEIIHDERLGPLLPEYKDFCRDILTSAEHLFQVISDILDLSKIEAGKMEYRWQEVDLGRLTDEVLESMRPLAAARSITLDHQAEAAVPITSDGRRLKQVLYNYVSNAIKFSEPSGHVVIRTGPDGEDRVRLDVIDGGRGIAIDDQRRLFEPFQQLDSGLGKRHGGTGLGLALTKEIVQGLGGTVGVESAPGAGSRFYAVLPIVPPGWTSPLS